MISNKIGTQNFSKSVQNHNFGDDGTVHYAPATPEVNSGPSAAQGKGARTSDARNIGDQLNQVANPGGKDPSKSTRKTHNTLDKDDFLKLMLTQMKNQDPMNPMQSHEMAAQLAQFTSLEQLFNVNKNLEGLTKAQDPVQKYEALNFLGKTIKADTRQIVRAAGDQGTDLRFSLLGDATKVKVTIADEFGQNVKTIEFGNLKKGANKITWAGTDKDDRDVKPGKFIFNVEAEGNGGKKIGVLTETKGTITGVNYTPEGPMLMVGDQSVRLQDIQKIEDDSLKEKQNIEEQMRLLAPEGAAANAVPEQVLKNLTSQAKMENAKGNNSQGSNPLEHNKEENKTIGEQPFMNAKNNLAQFAGPRPIDRTDHTKRKVMPESKPEAKLEGAILPLEVASANAEKASTGSSGISTGGAFGHR